MALSPEIDKRLCDLMQKAQTGDKLAYQSLLKEACDIVRGFVERRIGRGADSEDVLQEILVSVHRARHTYIKDKPFAPWLFAIARYRVCDYWRKVTRRLEVAESDPEDSNAFTSGQSGINESMADRLAQSLGRLPEKQRHIIDLLKLRGLSVREAAKELKMSEAALKVAAHRAYGALRKQFEMETDGYA